MSGGRKWKTIFNYVGHCTDAFALTTQLHWWWASSTSRRGSLAGSDERGEAEGYWCEKEQQILMKEFWGSTNHSAVADDRWTGGSMQSCHGSPWNEATQDGRWLIVCRKLKGSRKDVQMHLWVITQAHWLFKRSKTITFRELPPALPSTTKSVYTTGLPLPATVIAVKAACPAVEKPSCMEKFTPGSHQLLLQCSQHHGASQQKLNNPAQRVKSFSVLLEASLKCRDKTFMEPMGLGFLDLLWHGFGGLK